jgi:hypothetical protein
VVPPRPFRARVGDNLVRCRCNIQVCYHTSDGVPIKCSGENDSCSSGRAISLCLPPELNMATANPDGRRRLLVMGDLVFGAFVDDYCRVEVPKIVYSVLGNLNGGEYGFCFEKQCVAPEGGIGHAISCHPEVFDDSAFATRDHDECLRPCGDVACTATNCPFDKVLMNGVHPEYCRCNLFPGGGCDGTPSPRFCQPPPPS